MGRYHPSITDGSSALSGQWLPPVDCLRRWIRIPGKLWYSWRHKLRISEHAISNIGYLCGDRRIKPLRGRHAVGSNFRRSSTGLNSGYRNWLGLRHQRRVCTENFQLTGAKVSTPEFRGNKSKLSRHFKGLYLNRECGSSIPGWSATQFCVRPASQDARMGRKSRLFAHSVSSPNSRFADVEAEIAESLRPLSANIPVLERLWAETGSITTAARWQQSCLVH